ncbi:MAG: hypothetical protein HQK77_14185 [Desulfobacterales bacterium]|nr:hypothetical protein [Desulfobacterales bacterium]
MTLKLPQIKRGDIFLTRSEGFLGQAIRTFENIWDPDVRADWNHGGFFYNECPAESIEALPEGITGRRWPQEFGGEKILIARHELMDDVRFWQGFQRVEMEIGEPYPFHRLILHAFKPLAEINLSGMNVCTEIVQMFCFFAGLTTDRHGWNPHDITNWIWQGPPWRIVWGGVP